MTKLPSETHKRVFSDSNEKNVVNYLIKTGIFPLVRDSDLPYWRKLWDWQLDAEAAYAEKTQMALAGDWKKFVDFCIRYHRSPLPATSETLVLFIYSHIRYIEQERLLPEFERGIAVIEKRLTDSAIEKATQPVKIETVRRYIYTIRKAHSAAETATNPADSEKVTLAMRTITRVSDGEQSQAKPIRHTEITRIAELRNESLRDLQDVALTLLDRDLGNRVGSLVAINCEDIQWLPTGSIVRIVTSKTDIGNRGEYKKITSGTARVLKEWLQRSNIVSGPIFRGLPGRLGDVSKIPEKPMSTNAVRAAIKRCLLRCGFSAEGISGHSVRIGGAMDLKKMGKSDIELMDYGNWKSVQMPQRYTQQLKSEKKPFEEED